MGEADLIQHLRDLQYRNDTLANDVTMKEIIINCIEYKMFEVSKHVVKATEFNRWIDGILREKMIAEAKADEIVKINHWEQIRPVLEKYIENVQLKEETYIDQLDKWLDERKNREIKLEIENKEYRCMLSNIEETISKFGDVCSILKKHMKDKKKDNEMSCVQHVDEWLTQKKNTEMKLRKENEEYRKMITNIERGITNLDCKIENFTECLNNSDISLLNCAQPFYDDSFKNMLEYIQKLIRRFDEEDNEFQIREFPLWLEKIQCRIDDLENDLINEQKLRGAAEKQYAMEREILNYLFNQKQKEISLLKEKVYGKSSSDEPDLPNIVNGETMITITESIPDNTV